MIWYAVIAGVCLPLVLLWKKVKLREEHRIYALILAAVGLLGLVTNLTDQGDTRLQEDENGAFVLERERAGGRSYEESLRLSIDGVYDDTYTVEVQAKPYQTAELEEIFAQAAAEAESAFPKENEEPSHISEEVNLLGYAVDGTVKVDYAFSPANVISSDGKLKDENIAQEGQVVEVTLLLKYAGRSAEHTFYVEVYPRTLTKSERVMETLSESLEEQNEGNADVITLPQQIGDMVLHWSIPRKETDYTLLLLGVIAVAGLYFAKENDKRMQIKQRQVALRDGYPAMVSTLTLLLNAGMTVSAAWERIVRAYLKKREKGGEEEAVCEEMLITSRQIQDGMGERAAYEDFAGRTGEPCYRKLISLVLQNMRKGGKDLCTMLERETEDALEQQRSNAKVKGEEASTKMLLPMMLNLVVVIVAIVVPAMIGMKI